MMKKSEQNFPQLEVLVYTATRKDGELTVNILSNAGFSARAVADFKDLTESMLNAGAIIISEECLSTSLLKQLREKVEAQAQWSDLPIITVTAGDNSSIESNERLETIVTYLQNVTLLERPIRLATLITIIRTALSSRRKQFELKTILEDLEWSKKIADEANEAKSIFLANMSHEIRTPLAAIVGFAGLIKDQQLPTEERLSFADAIARNGDQLSSLINDILDLSKVEAGKIETELIEVSLPGLFQEVANWLRPMVENKGLKFAFRLKSNVPELIKADITRIRQVLLNLVSNAVKFTSTGSVSVEFETKVVSADQVRILFEVIDTGIGMSDQDKLRLFKPFSQADSSMTRRFGGTGLGLVLSKALANAMDGDLRLVESHLNKGSRFEFSFRAELITDSPSIKIKSKIAEELLQGTKVLVVEDSPDNQFLMNRYLTSAGAEVTTAENGKVGIECALKDRFDVILMDIQMPVMDGLSATRELRNKNYRGPIIALTAHALKEEKDRSLNAGCNDHLTKPIDRELLIYAIASHVETRIT